MDLFAGDISGYRVSSVVLDSGGVAKIVPAMPAVDGRLLVSSKINRHVSHVSQQASNRRTESPEKVCIAKEGV